MAVATHGGNVPLPTYEDRRAELDRVLAAPPAPTRQLDQAEIDLRRALGVG